MNFDNKIKNDFGAWDRTRALWMKDEHVNHSTMGQTNYGFGTFFETFYEFIDIF
jgi:hypothetical protein